MPTLGRNTILLLCAGLVAGCAGIPVARNGGKAASSPRKPAVKYPSECVRGVCLGAYSDVGGDPRIPVADLSVELPASGGALAFSRVYDSMDMDSGAFGRSWFHSYESRVSTRSAASVFFGSSASAGIPQLGGNGSVDLAGKTPEVIAELRGLDGRRLIYKQNSDGSFTAPAGESAVLAAAGSGFTLTTLDKTVYTYNAAGRLASIADANGIKAALEYNNGVLAAVKDRAGRTVYSFAYNGDGTLASVTDLGGRAVTFGYSGGMLSTALNPEGLTAYGYGDYPLTGLASFGRGVFADAQATLGTMKLINSVTSPNGNVTSFTYGAPAQVVDYASQASAINTGVNYTGAITDKLSFWGYNAQPVTAGKPELTVDKYYYAPVIQSTAGYVLDKAVFAMWYFPQGYLTTGESGPRGSYTFTHTIDELLGIGSTEMTDPLGHKSVHKWEAITGRTVGMAQTDAAGGTTSTAYDTRTNPVQVTDRAGRTTQFVYDSKNNVTAVIDPLGNRTNFGYEPLFNGLASVMDPRGNSSSFGYDAKGNMTSAQDAQGNTVHIDYDAAGLPVSVTDPLNHAVTITRDANGYATQVTDPLSRSAHMGYDGLGRVVSFTDGANKTTQFQYDAGDNLTQVTDALNGVTRYTYQPGIFGEGKLLSSLEDAKNQTTAFGYDAKGRLTSVTNPLNQTRAYEYDAADNLTKVTKADGTVITFTYDALNRLTAKNIPGNPVNYTYDLAGNLVAAENNDSKVQIGYDADDRPIEVVQTNKAANLTSDITYAYDQNGNRTRMTLAGSPSALVWEYTYDSLNRLTQITTPELSSIRFEYDALSRRTRMVYPNGTEADYTYDAASQLTGIIHKRTSDNSIIAQTGYTYDNAGNRTSMTDTAGTHNCGYDDLHRLTSASHPTGSALDIKNETFSYDAVGNRLSDAVRTGYAYNAANRLTEDSLYTYTYDANGNTTGKTAKADNAHTTYVYNAENQLAQVTMPDGLVAAYKYDTLGRRMEKVVSTGTTTTTTRYVYDGEDIIAVLDGNNALISRITHGAGIDEPLTLKTGTSNYYYQADGLGSITALTDDSGAIVETMEYQAYGKPVFRNAEGTVIANSAIDNPYSYTAREYDAAAGAFYYRHRTYSQEIGRFSQEDPIGFMGGDVNFYSYASDSPVYWRDPLGLHTVRFLSNGFPWGTGDAVYTNWVLTTNDWGVPINISKGSIYPDPKRKECSNGCPTIKSGTYHFSYDNFPKNVPIRNGKPTKKRYPALYMGEVETREPNPNNANKPTAVGVWVHKGGTHGTGATGCLTISPDYWVDFINNFNKGSTGVVKVW